MFKKLILLLLLFLASLSVGFSPSCGPDDPNFPACADKDDLADEVENNPELIKDEEVKKELPDEQLEKLIRNVPELINDIPVDDVNDRNDEVTEAFVDAAVAAGGTDKDVVEAEDGLTLKDFDSDAGTVTLDGGGKSLEVPTSDIGALAEKGLIDEGEIVFEADGSVTLGDSIVMSGSEGEDTKILGMQENKETGKIEVYMEGGGNVVIIGDEPSKYVFITGEDSTVIKGTIKHSCLDGCKTDVEDGKLVLTGNNIETTDYLLTPERVFVSDGTVVSDFGSLNPQSGAVVTEYEEAIIGDSSSRKAIVTYNVPENTPELKIMYDYPGLDSDEGNWVYNDREGDAFYGKFDENINLGFYGDAPLKIDLYTQRLKNDNKVVIAAGLNEESKTTSYFIVDSNNNVFGSDPSESFKNSDIEVSQLNSDDFPELFVMDYSKFSGAAEMNVVGGLWKCSTLSEGSTCAVGPKGSEYLVMNNCPNNVPKPCVGWPISNPSEIYGSDGKRYNKNGDWINSEGSLCLVDSTDSSCYSSNKDYFDVPNSKGEYVLSEKGWTLAASGLDEIVNINDALYTSVKCPGSIGGICYKSSDGETYGEDGKFYNDEGNWVDKYTGASCSEGTSNAACYSSNRRYFNVEGSPNIEYISTKQEEEGVMAFDEFTFAYNGENYRYVYSEESPYCGKILDGDFCVINGLNYAKSECGGSACFSWTGDDDHYNLDGVLIDKESGRFIDSEGNFCNEACAWSKNKPIFEARVQTGVALNDFSYTTTSGVDIDGNFDFSNAEGTLYGVTSNSETGSGGNLFVGVQQVVDDAGDTMSYGNFGFNSNGLAPSFWRKYGSELGLEGTPGTSTADASWAKVAKENPEALINAEIEHYNAEIITPTIRVMQSEGFSKDFYTNVNVITFLSDSRIQLGSGGQNYVVSTFPPKESETPDEYLLRLKDIQKTDDFLIDRFGQKVGTKWATGLRNRVDKRYTGSYEVTSIPGITTDSTLETVTTDVDSSTILYADLAVSSTGELIETSTGKVVSPGMADAILSSTQSPIPSLVKETIVNRG